MQEASYDYMEKEGERTFLECLDQLEVANARLESVSAALLVDVHTTCTYGRYCVSRQAV